MASDIPSNTVAGPNLVEISSNLIEKAVYSAGINSRPSQDISFPFTSPNVADCVPCIDTSIFTSLPTASFNELLQQYEDPAVSVSDTFSQTPQKGSLTILPLDGVETNVATTDIDTSAKTLPDVPCACSVTDGGDEVPVEQVFIRDGQMYRLPEAGVVALAGMEFNAFFRNNQWYISLPLLFHAVGPEAKKHLEKAIVGAANLDVLTLGDNELELLTQKTGFTDEILKELMSIGSLQAISRSISQKTDISIIRNIACGDIYKKVLGNNVRCSNCGLIIKKEPAEEKYELIWTHTVCDSLAASGIPFTVGMVSASNAKFCAFQMNDKTYINLAELVRFKMFTWASVQKKLFSLGVSPDPAPIGVEEQFDSGLTLLSKGQWLDLINLRCLCCMGNGKCTIRGHSEEVWQALKMGHCTYEAGISLIAMDETQNAVGSIPVSEPEQKTISPTSTETFVNSESTIIDRKDGRFSNGSEEHVSSTTDGFVPGTPQMNLNEDQTEQRPEPLYLVENITAKQSEGATINTPNEIAEPSGEVIEVKIAEVKETDEVDTEEISRQFGFKTDNSEPQDSKTYSENVENVREDGYVEVVDHVTVNKDTEDCSNSRTITVENKQEEFQDYFIGRPRGRPTKHQDAFVFKPPVEKSIKRGSIYLFPGDCIVPDLEELNRQIESKKVIIGQKNLAKEVINEKSIAERLKLQKASTAKVCFSGKKAVKQMRNSSESPQTKSETTSSDSEKELKPVISSNNVSDTVETIVEQCQSSDVINSLLNTRQPDHSSALNEKVVIEYVHNRVEPDGQKFIAHEKEVEKAEICFMPLDSRSNLNTPEKIKISNTSKLPEHGMEINDSVVARNIWPDNQTETCNITQFTSPVVESNTSDRLSSGISESFRSPVPGIFTPTQPGSVPRTPPSRRVETLAKLSNSESFSGPDAVLLALATLATENGSGSDQEQDEIGTQNKKSDQMRSEQSETEISNKTFNQITNEKDQREAHQNELDKNKIVHDQIEKDSKLDNVTMSRIGNRNHDSEPKLDHGDESFEEASPTDDKDKLEMLAKLKKCVTFTYDNEFGIWKVNKFTENAKVEFPGLFVPNSEVIRTKVAFELSLFVTNNFCKFLQYKRGRNHENTVDKSKGKVSSEQVPDIRDSVNKARTAIEGSPSVSNTEGSGDQPKTSTSINYSSSMPSVQNTGKKITQDLELEMAVKSISAVKDENMEMLTNRSDKLDSISTNPCKDMLHVNKNVKCSRGRPRKKKQDIVKDSNRLESEDMVSKAKPKVSMKKLSGKKEKQVTEPVKKSESAENVSDVKYEKQESSDSVVSHEPLVVRINTKIGTVGKKKKRPGRPPKKPQNLVSNENIQCLIFSDKEKTSGKKRKRVNSSDLEKEVSKGAVSKLTKSRIKVEEHYSDFQNSDSNSLSVSTLSECVNSISETEGSAYEENTNTNDLMSASSSESVGIVTFGKEKTANKKLVQRSLSSLKSKKKAVREDLGGSGETNETYETGADKFVNSEAGIEKLVIRRDKSGKHVLQSTDKPKRKQKSTETTCKSNNKRKRTSFTIYADDAFQKNSESSIQCNDCESNQYNSATVSQNRLPKKELLKDCKVKPLKIKLIQASNENSVCLSDEEMADFSQVTEVKTEETSSEDTISDEKLKFFRAVSLVGPVTGFAIHSNERLSRSPVQKPRDTRQSRARSLSVSPSKSPIKESINTTGNTCGKQLSKSPDKHMSKKMKLVDSNDKTSRKPSKSPKRNSSLEKGMNANNDLKNKKSTETKSFNLNTNKTRRKHSESPKRSSELEKKITNNDLIERLTDIKSVNPSTDKTSRKYSESPKKRISTSEESKTRMKDKSERKLSKSQKKYSSKKEKKSQTDNEISNRNLSKSPNRHPSRIDCNEITHNETGGTKLSNSPKSSPKKS